MDETLDQLLNQNKVITLDTLKVIVDIVKRDYATNVSVDEKIREAGFVYASEEEVRALFDDDSAAEETDTGETAGE